MTQRALFGTTSFEIVAGSELVILEIAESLMARGYACDLAAFSVGDPMLKLAKSAGLRVLPKVADAKPLQYDLVWLQTQIGSAMDFTQASELRERTLLAFAHLDLTWDLAAAGPVLEDAVADRFMFPSPEAAAHFALQGLSGPKAQLFHNAAPVRFARPAGVPRRALRKLLMVSNHLPDELAGAASLLRARGIDVQHWGRSGDIRDTRLMPRHLDSADAIIGIGKTVQYALLGRVPVFVYDHFGGPGWLSPANFDDCAYANFSGRCCRRVLVPDAIVAEIEQGFDEAALIAASWPDRRLAPYRLDRQVAALLAGISAAPDADARLAKLATLAIPLAREKRLSAAAGHYFAAWRRASRSLDAGTRG